MLEIFKLLFTLLHLAAIVIFYGFLLVVGFHLLFGFVAFAPIFFAYCFIFGFFLGILRG